MSTKIIAPIFLNPKFAHYFETSSRIILAHVGDAHFPAGVTFPNARELDILYWSRNGIYENLDTYRFPNVKRIFYDGKYTGSIVRCLGSKFEKVVIPDRMDDTHFVKEKLEKMDSNDFDAMYHGLNLTYHHLQFQALLRSRSLLTFPDDIEIRL